MGWGKTEEEKAKEAQSKAAARATRDRERAEAAYWASPVGQADQAKREGARFFQVEIPHKSVTGYANAMWSSTGVHQRQTNYRGAPDVLGQIEDLGWRLDHASWVFTETGQSSRDKFLASGQQTVVTGEVIGIYLFRNVS